MNTAEERIERIIGQLQRATFSYASEDQLQEGIAGFLRVKGFDVDREFRLGPKDRIDMMIDGIGIEVKVRGNAADARRQLARYGRSPQVDGLILATTRSRGMGHLPLAISGVPLRVFPIFTL